MILNAYRRARRGFTLIEMVVVMWSLGICLLLGTALIVTCMKANRAGLSAANRVSMRGDLADQFRADVAAAEAAPERLGDIAAGLDCLILRMAGGSTVLYRWRGETLVRVERTNGSETTRRVPIGSRGAKAEFVRPQGMGRMFTIRITEPVGPTGATRRADLSAALGGDLR